MSFIDMRQKLSHSDSQSNLQSTGTQQVLKVRYKQQGAEVAKSFVVSAQLTVADFLIKVNDVCHSADQNRSDTALSLVITAADGKQRVIARSELMLTVTTSCRKGDSISVRDKTTSEAFTVDFDVPKGLGKGRADTLDVLVTESSKSLAKEFLGQIPLDGAKATFSLTDDVPFAIKIDSGNGAITTLGGITETNGRVWVEVLQQQGKVRMGSHPPLSDYRTHISIPVNLAMMTSTLRICMGIRASLLQDYLENT